MGSNHECLSNIFWNLQEEKRNCDWILSQNVSVIKWSRNIIVIGRIQTFFQLDHPIYVH
jgi:uracil-DNA glycosylase